MTTRLVVALACAALGTGCVSKPLHRNTLQQASTLSDLYERQVLDNLALFCANPDAVPSFAVPAGGVVSVQNQVSGTFVLQASGSPWPSTAPGRSRPAGSVAAGRTADSSPPNGRRPGTR